MLGGEYKQIVSAAMMVLGDFEGLYRGLLRLSKNTLQHCPKEMRVPSSSYLTSTLPEKEMTVPSSPYLRREGFPLRLRARIPVAQGWGCFPPLLRLDGVVRRRRVARGGNLTILEGCAMIRSAQHTPLLQSVIPPRLFRMGS
jgi:hypothetical protein